jgi:hypothetical protein
MISDRGQLSCHGAGCDLPGAKPLRRRAHVVFEGLVEMLDAGLPREHPGTVPSPAGGPRCTRPVTQ